METPRLSSLPSSRCRRCPLFTRLHFHVPATRVVGAKIAIVGEAPGRWEVQQRRGFVGPAGQLLDVLLKAAGIERKEIGITNILKCQPKDNKLPDDLDLAIECCSEILWADLEGVEVIVGMGNVPLRALVGLDRISVRRGSVYELPDGRPYVATLHPAFLLRSRFIKHGDETKVIPKEVVAADLARARRIAEGENWKVYRNFVLEPTEQEKAEFLRRLYKPEDMVSVDVETPKSKPRWAIPNVLSFSLDDITISVLFEEDLEFVRDALKSPTPKCTHGGMFDVAVFENLGLEVVNWIYDSQYAHHTLYSELSHKLGFVQSLHSYLPYHKDMKAQAFAEMPELGESEEMHDK